MKQSNQSGFAAVEALLIVIILIIVGGTGYFVWHSRLSANSSLNQASKALPVYGSGHAFYATSSRLPTNWNLEISSTDSVTLAPLDHSCTVTAIKTVRQNASVANQEAITTELYRKTDDQNINRNKMTRTAPGQLTLRTNAGNREVTTYGYNYTSPQGKNVDNIHVVYLINDGNYDTITADCNTLVGLQQADQAIEALVINT